MLQWYVIYTKPRQEREVRERLKALEIEIYLPMCPLARRRAERARAEGRRALAPRALFPRYLFCHIDLEQVELERLRWTPGVVNLLMFDGQYARVPEPVIAHIRARLASFADERRFVFEPGQRVRLPEDHPLARMEALFEKPCSDKKRAYVLLEVLGRLTRAEVALDDLEPAEGLAYVLEQTLR